MKKQNILLLGLIMVMLWMTSCEDFLTQEPRLKQTTELTLSNYDGMMDAAVAAYDPMYGANWYARNFPVIADLKGGNSKISPITSGRFVQEYLWNNTPTNSSYLWTNAYDVIARANNIINALDGFEEPGVTEEELMALEGEVKFIRALAYFDMARLYCPSYIEGRENIYGLPIVLVTEIGQPSRNTVGETYDLIVSDLEFAVEHLTTSPIHQSETGDPKGWTSKYAAAALLARVHLYMESWQEAADYATMVIDNGEYRLYTPEEFTTWDLGGVWGTDAAPEIIFEIYGSEGNTAHPNWDQITYIMSPDGYGDIGASMDVINLYEASDVRANLFTNTPEYPDDYWSLKYPGKGGNLRIDDIPVLRLSEMYLIRAEATLNGASTGVTAADDLNAIRSQRNASDITNPTLNDVYDERRRELCFEGHQLFDLKRTGRGLVRIDFDGIQNQNIPYPDYRWAFPIPIDETDANPNIEQNPGYSSTN
jgi:hypothetical protein